MTDHQKDQTNPGGEKFDFAAYPDDTMFHERRAGRERRQRSGPAPAAEAKSTNPDQPAGEQRVKKERRRRIDPTTFEKQYTDDEIEFMNAMQRFKMQSGRSFPTYGEVLKVAHNLGYRKVKAHRATTALEGPTARSEGAVVPPTTATP